jgi:MraZ protein
VKRKTLLGLLLSTVLLYLAGTLFVCKVLQADRAPAEVDRGVGVELAAATATIVAIEDAGEPAPLARPLPSPGVIEPVQLTTALAPPIPTNDSTTPAVPEAGIPPAPDPIPCQLEPRASLLHPEPPHYPTVPGAVAVGAGWQRGVQVVHRPFIDGEPAPDPTPPPSEPLPAPVSPCVPVSATPEATHNPGPEAPPAPIVAMPSRPAPPVALNPLLAQPLSAVPKASRSKSRLEPLTGIHRGELDEKHALTLPAGVREQLGRSLPRKLYLTVGTDASLWVYTADGLDRLAEQLERSKSDTGSAQAFRRLYFAHTEPGPVDRDGHLMIPEHLVQFAGLQREVILIGVRDHFEIWDAQHWQQYLDQHVPSVKPVSRRETGQAAGR